MKHLKILIIISLFIGIINPSFASVENLDYQRESIYNVNIDDSVDYTMNLVMSNSDIESINCSGVLIEEGVMVHFSKITFSVWDVNWGVYHFMPFTETIDIDMRDTILFPGSAIASKWIDQGDNIQKFTITAYVGNISLAPAQRYFFKIYFHADNFAGNQPLGQNSITFDVTEKYEVNEGLKVIHIIVPTPKGNYSKNRLIVNLPQDTYHWSDSVFAYPNYDYIEFNNGRTSMAWDLKKLMQDNNNINQKIISLSYKIHENEIKKDLENATFTSLAYSNQSLEYAKKADYWGKIALIIAIISIPSAIWSSRNFIKWIKEKISNLH